jgi:hypothetical protein
MSRMTRGCVVLIARRYAVQKLRNIFAVFFIDSTALLAQTIFRPAVRELQPRRHGVHGGL